MRFIGMISVLAFGAAACAASGDLGEELYASPSTGGGGQSQCSPETQCGGCGTCYEACLCFGGTEAQCIPACFDNGGPPTHPPPDPPPPDPPPPDPPPPDPPPPDPPPIAAWPAGPYGTQVGQTVNEAYAWEGYFDGAPTPSTIAVRDLFDPDGSKGINAILFLQSAFWCGNCRQEAGELNGRMASGWAAKGVKVITLIIEDQFQFPANLGHAELWKNQYNAQGWSTAADPGFTFASFGSNGLPVHILVNPRDMRIVDKSNGYTPFYPQLDQLLIQNGAF